MTHTVDDCKKDMAAIETAARNIREALTRVNQLMTNTWVGAAADQWGTDFHGRMTRLTSLLSLFPQEAQRLIDKAHKDHAAKPPTKP